MAKTSSFEGTAGGAVPEGRIKVTASEFGYHEDYMSGTAMVLLLEYTLDGEEQDRPLLFSTGSGWEPKKGGKIAVLEDTGEPNPKGFNRNSEIFKWMKSCAEAGMDLEKVLGEAYNAEGWVGVELDVEEREEKNPVSGEMNGKCRAVKFYGKDGGGKKKKDKGAKSAADDDA